MRIAIEGLELTSINFDCIMELFKERKNCDVVFYCRHYLKSKVHVSCKCCYA